jgi:hypothetical protein
MLRYTACLVAESIGLEAQVLWIESLGLMVWK